MQIKLATEEYIKATIDFFEKNLDKENEALVSREFLCSFGIKAAVKRRQVMICTDGNEIIAAVRFYPRKTDGIVSVYQFAVDEKYRGNKLLQKMLQLTQLNQFEFKCPKDINFNDYYDKIGASIDSYDEEYNFWVLTF